MSQLFSNNARSTLSAGISAADTALVIQTAHADLFPVANTGAAPVSSAADWFKAVLQDAAGDVEIVYVRTRTTGSATMSNLLRGQEGTTARTFIVGSVVGLRITAADMEGAVRAPELLQNSALQWLTGVTGTNAITGSLTPAIMAYAAGQTFRFTAAGANTGAVTININGLGVRNITREGAIALVAGDIPASAVCEIVFDGTQFQLQAVSRVTNATNATNLTGNTPAAVPVGALGSGTADATTFLRGDRTFQPVSAEGVFFKADPTTVTFIRTGNNTASIKAGTKVAVAGVTVSFASATAIIMPTLTLGTDYAIFVCTDGSIRADANWSAPTGYTTANSRRIGGFHFAPGGNAVAQTGGSTTPQINEFSLWDLKFRPSCPDPRGMTLVGDSFWADIYLLGQLHLINGTSRYNVSIADGPAPPRIPTKFGGNGSNNYGSMTWWEANEVLQSHGKRSPTYAEFAALAYGTTEAGSSGGTDVPTTGVSGTGATSAWNIFTSRWGVIQATGCMWVWSSDFGGGAIGGGWTANTGGRGSTHQMENVALLGGDWAHSGWCGSRCSFWGFSPTASSNIIGARGVCGHLTLE